MIKNPKKIFSEGASNFDQKNLEGHLKTFLKFSCLLGDETNSSFLYSFDDVIANAADSFQFKVDKTGFRDIARNRVVEVRDRDIEYASENTKTCLKG